MNRTRSGWLSVCAALLLSIGLPIAAQSIDSKHMRGYRNRQDQGGP